MGIKITGLDEVKKNLDNLSRKAKEIDGTHQVGISELMPAKNSPTPHVIMLNFIFKREASI